MFSGSVSIVIRKNWRPKTTVSRIVTAMTVFGRSSAKRVRLSSTKRVLAKTGTNGSTGLKPVDIPHNLRSLHDVELLASSTRVPSRSEPAEQPILLEGYLSQMQDAPRLAQSHSRRGFREKIAAPIAGSA